MNRGRLKPITGLGLHIFGKGVGVVRVCVSVLQIAFDIITCMVPDPELLRKGLRVMSRWILSLGLNCIWSDHQQKNMTRHQLLLN